MIKNESKSEVIPLSSVSIAYGVSQQITAYTGLHTSAAYQGIYQVDAGFSHELITPFNVQPGITYSLAVNSFFDRQASEFKLYPQVDLNAYWLLPYRNDFFYIGFSNWLELATEKAHKQTQETHWIPSIHTGYTLQFDKYGLNLEVKYIAPFNDNQDLLLDYISPTNKGTLGAYVSMSRKF